MLKWADWCTGWRNNERPLRSTLERPLDVRYCRLLSPVPPYRPSPELLVFADTEFVTMKRIWTSLALIACMVMSLVMLDQFTPQSPGAFLKLALTQKHPLLLVLATQAALIAIVASGIVDRPAAKAATVIAGLAIFAAEIGRLDQSLPTGMQIAAVALIPIGLTLTNIIPLPRTTRGWLAVTLACSIATFIAVWVIAITKAGPILAVIFGDEIVTAVLVLLIVASFAFGVGSFLGLIGVVQGQNTQPARTRPVSIGKKKKKRARR